MCGSNTSSAGISGRVSPIDSTQLLARPCDRIFRKVLLVHHVIVHRESVHRIHLRPLFLIILHFRFRPSRSAALSPRDVRPNRAQSPVEIFVQMKTHLGRGEGVLSCFFQERDDLLALYARESIEKLLDRIARFQVIEKTLHRNASSGKNRLPTKNFRVLRYDAAHDNKEYRMSVVVAKSIFAWTERPKSTAFQASIISRLRCMRLAACHAVVPTL